MVEEEQLTREKVTDAILHNIGLRGREIAADASHLPKEVSASQVAANLMDPRLQPRGFGLIGPTGVGKSMALAYLIKSRVEWNINTAWPKYRDKLPIISANWGVMWINWPERAEWLRRNGFGELYEAFIDKATRSHILILDDIGSERVKGDASNEDFARHALAQIVDARYRDNLHTWYTSNLKPQDMPGFYSDRAVSRLLGDNPPIIITGRDQRLRRQ